MDGAVEIGCHDYQLQFSGRGIVFLEYVIGDELIVGVGTYASVQSIINDYSTGAIRDPFSCADNGL